MIIGENMVDTEFTKKTFDFECGYQKGIKDTLTRVYKKANSNDIGEESGENAVKFIEWLEKEWERWQVFHIQEIQKLVDIIEDGKNNDKNIEAEKVL